MEPDDVTDDVSPDILKEMKENSFKAQVAVMKQEAITIEEATRDQAGSYFWKKESCVESWKHSKNEENHQEEQ